MKTRGLSEIIWTVLKAMIRVLKAMFLKSSQSVKVREGYVKGNVKLFVGPYCFLGKLAVREGPWRVREGKREGRNTGVKNLQSVKVREEKREANTYESDVVSERFLSLVSALVRFLDISKAQLPVVVMSRIK